ncbi:MAG: hypothetical protein SFW36_13665 [Leptolyngbyaceae cyanobacterium bins.59]|nr:hypothetical protein [Leptolyngbyaceae cyanobacterium bins.59]
MNVWPRFLKATYRKEPISSFVLTVGVVDALIGGFDTEWVLFTVGVSTVGIALGLRWWLMQRSRIEMPQPVAQRYLPAASSNASLPMLSISKKRPRR